MREAVFEFELLTPAILAGADQQSAEMRIPSIRGALRWWTRLIAGKEEEKRISKTLDVKKTGTVREKIEACPIKFYL